MDFEVNLCCIRLSLALSMVSSLHCIKQRLVQVVIIKLSVIGLHVYELSIRERQLVVIGILLKVTSCIV